MNQSKALNSTQIARAAVVVLVGFLASGVLGFIRTLIISAQFGTSEALDAFYAAQRIPEIIFVLVAGGALGSSFIPVYTRCREQDENEAWRLASAVMTLASLAAGILGLLIALTAPSLVENILLRDSSPESQILTTNMIRLMMITPFIFSMSGLIMGILQTHGLFLLPSLAISMNSLGIIIGAIFIAPSMPSDMGIAQVGDNNVYGLAIGAVLSAILHLVVQIPGLFHLSAKLRPLPYPNIPGVIDVLKLMGPRVLGLGVVQINFVVNIILTAPMIEGSLSALTTAYQLMFFALGIVAQSVGSAVFPTLATMAAEDNMDGFKNHLASAMRSVLFLALPSTVALILLAQPVVSIFERGEWTSESTTATAWALAFYAIGMAGFAILEVLSRAFYALSDTRTPVVIGIAAMASNIILSLIFAQLIGDKDSLARGPFAGLALANSSTTLVEAAILWWLLRRRIGSIHDSHIMAGIWRAGLASMIMGVVLFLIHNLLSNNSGYIIVLAGAVFGGATFFCISIALDLQEAKAMSTMILGRIRR